MTIATPGTELAALLRLEGARNVVWKLDATRYTVGRLDQPTPDTQVSREHFRLEQIDGSWYITDISTNGTYNMGPVRPEDGCVVSETWHRLPQGKPYKLEIGVTWLIIGQSRAAIKVIEVSPGMARSLAMEEASRGW